VTRELTAEPGGDDADFGDRDRPDRSIVIAEIGDRDRSAATLAVRS